MKQALTLTVNGDDREIFVEPTRTLLEVLRYDLHLTGAKGSCEIGACGSCTVMIDGKAAKSCLVLAGQAQDAQIVTIEGLAKHGTLHPLQQSFLDNFAVSCGYCTPGMIMAAKALLDENPDPSETEVREALVGNLCRCTGYVTIVDAVLAASKAMQDSEGELAR
ncbi:MAG TPA: (2Fe-2S)-binding protein [Sphingobium sp.]|nr:(2Fe-2S)-binding protein [Sphingobium sp.]